MFRNSDTKMFVPAGNIQSRKTKKMGKHEQVSLRRDAAAMINGARTSHTWAVWETKSPAGICFFFIPAVHKTQKPAQAPQNS